MQVVKRLAKLYSIGPLSRKLYFDYRRRFTIYSVYSHNGLCPHERYIYLLKK